MIKYVSNVSENVCVPVHSSLLLYPNTSDVLLSDVTKSTGQSYPL